MTYTRRRVLSFAALAVVVLATWLVVRSDGGHTLHLRFMDAGQLVTGDSVDIAGRPIGDIDAIDLAPGGTADVKVRIHDDAWPLRLGTQAQIRLLSLSGLANRYIELTPGRAGAPALRDGDTIDLQSTQGVVDLDEVLDDFGPRVRHDLQTLIRGAGDAERGTARAGNEVLRYAPATLTQADALTAELSDDPPALAALLRSGARVATSLARHQAAVTSGIDDTERWVSAAADSRQAIAATLADAPRAIGRVNQTLERTRRALHDPIRPVLRALAPSALPLAGVLRRLGPAARTAAPALQSLRALLPDADTALQRLPALARTGVPALQSATSALSGAAPIFSGLRQYGPDIIAGQFTGVDSISALYDANGHYSRVPVQTGRIGVPGVSGLTEPILGPVENALGIDGLRTGLLAPCPGGAQNPTDDHSNPWLQDTTICDHKADQP